MAVFAYVRVATQNQVATDQQLQRIRAFAAERGMALPEENLYGEVCSGQSEPLDRTVWMRLWHRLEPKDVLVLTNLDRIGRSVKLIRFWLKELAERGVIVETILDQDD